MSKIHHFNVLGQKTGDYLVLVMVVEQDMIGEVPEIFTVNGMMPPQNIYTGTYPAIRLIMNTIQDKTEELKGQGLAGHIQDCLWYVKSEKLDDGLADLLFPNPSK